MKKTFVIGDVHGCFYTLMDLVKKLPKNSEMIFTGDLCDKGFYSKEVIEFVRTMQDVFLEIMIIICQNILSPL